MNYNFKIHLHKEEEDGLMVTVPSLPGCFIQGDDLNLVIAIAKEAIELYKEFINCKNEI